MARLGLVSKGMSIGKISVTGMWIFHIGWTYLLMGSGQEIICNLGCICFAENVFWKNLFSDSGSRRGRLSKMERKVIPPLGNRNPFYCIQF